MKTGTLIKELRIKKGMTQEELASLTELSVRTIQRIENGEVDPRSYSLQMIAKALEVDFGLFAAQVSDESMEMSTVNHRHWLGFLHLSGLLPLVFPSVIIWNLRKDKTNAPSVHFRAVMALQLCVLGIALIGGWVYWKVHQPAPLAGGLLAGGLLSVFNAIRVMNGAPFVNPLIKNPDNNQNPA